MEIGMYREVVNLSYHKYIIEVMVARYESLVKKLKI
jgi:hypothetical protein